MLLLFRFGRKKESNLKAGSDPVRGIRNNNPGNIRRSNDRWQGLASDQPDEEFFKFESMEYGARAMMIVLRNYILKRGANTIRKIVNRYSPPSDHNPTDALVRLYSERLGVNPDQVVYPQKDFIKDLAYEIARVEVANHEAVTKELFDKAYGLI